MAKGETGLSLESLGVQPPYSMTAEQSVLGAALLDTGAVDLLMQLPEGRLAGLMRPPFKPQAIAADLKQLTEKSAP